MTMQSTRGAPHPPEEMREGPPARVNPPEITVDGLHHPPRLAGGPGGPVYLSWSSTKPKPEGALFGSDPRSRTRRTAAGASAATCASTSGRGRVYASWYTAEMNSRPTCDRP
jgi:hypothetical protein